MPYAERPERTSSRPRSTAPGITSSTSRWPVERLLLVGTVVLAIWGAATVFVLAVAATTEIGPVVLDLSTNHGIHLGDLAAAAVAYVVATGLTAWVVSRGRGI